MALVLERESSTTSTRDSSLATTDWCQIYN